MAVIEEFDYLCRLCATKMGVLLGLPIFETGEHDQMRNIDKKIAACLPIKITISDQLPKVICEECAFKVEQLFDFREKVLQTEDMFMHILQTITKANLNSLKAVTVTENQESRLSNDSQNSSSIRNDVQNGIHTVSVIDNIDISSKDEEPEDEMAREDSKIQVADFNLDGDTVRMVNEQIREVSNQEIDVDLEGEMSVSVENLTVGNHLHHLTIDYERPLDSESHGQKRIMHYCDDEKFESVECKEMQNRLGSAHRRRHVALSRTTSIINGTLDTADHSSEHSFSVPCTSQINSCTDVIMVQYTKSAKNALLENVLTNPTTDETHANWYVCPFCNEAAAEPTNFAIHFEQHFCSCPNCELYFINVEELNIHNQSCAESKGTLNDVKLVNSLPQGQYQRQTDSEKKQNSRTKWTPKECTLCGKQYRTNYKLQEHMRRHTGEKPFQCGLCEKAFRSKIGLAQHTATHTGQFDFSCSICGKGFQCKSYLTVHQRVHSDLKPYSCTTCSQNFKTKQSLLDHENRHMGVKPYTCEICGRSFITKGLCKSHQKIHSGIDNRQYQCVVCNKMFVSKSYLNTHLRIHTGEKLYLCEVCGKGFLTRVDLKTHSTMHTGEKNFKCDLCGKVFARLSVLRCHRRSHTGERPYRCEVCGKTFTQFSPMAIHKRLHTGERPYECDVCSKSFVSKSTMMCHKKKHHANEQSVEKSIKQEILQQQKDTILKETRSVDTTID